MAKVMLDDEAVIYTKQSPPPSKGISFEGQASRTKQSFKQETDINSIMARYKITGILPPSAMNTRRAAFGDFSEVGDFQAAQDRLVKGRQAFEALPSRIRERFSNDPGQLLDFLADTANREEAISLGIIEKGPEPEGADNVPQDPPGGASEPVAS